MPALAGGYGYSIPTFVIVILHIAAHAVVIHIILRGRVKAAHIVWFMMTFSVRRWRRAARGHTIRWWRWSMTINPAIVWWWRWHVRTHRI